MESDLTSGISAGSMSTSSMKPKSTQFLIRPLHLSDIPTLAKQVTAAYADGAVTKFLTPKAKLYPSDVHRRNRQGIRNNFVNPRSMSVVACLASNPKVVVGYGQYMRIGEEGKAYVKERGLRTRLWLWILGWFFWVYHLIENKLFPNRALDPETMKIFIGWNREDAEKYWKKPERLNRWSAHSIIVSPEWQGRGAGRLLVEVGIERAQRDGVILGLLASMEGERLYRKMGFEYIGDFSHRPPGNEGAGGGIMIWYPKGWKGK